MSNLDSNTFSSFLEKSILALIALDQTPASRGENNHSFKVELFSNLIEQLQITPEELRIELDNRFVRNCNGEKVEETEPNVSKVLIEILPLSFSTKKLLAGVSIFSVGDLVKYSRKDLFKIRYLKAKRLDEIENILSLMGLKLSNGNKNSKKT